MGSFNLIRYFTLASLAVVVVLAGATAWVFSRNLERSLTEEAGLYALDISRSLNHSIFREFLLPRAQAGEDLNLDDPLQRTALDAVIANRTQGLRILTVILFDPSGTIIYSTKPDYIGFRSIDNPGIESALTGEPASFLKRAELEADPIRPGHDLLETYTPFYELDPDADHEGEIIGVLELYQDARPITTEIALGQRQILLATAALMILLFVALFEIVRRGQARITRLTAALETSNRELESRVRLRTREIESARHRLRSLFDGIADGISVIDEEYRITEFNSGIERLFGEAAPGVSTLCHERYASRPGPCPGCPARNAMESGRTAQQRYRWTTADGRETEVEVTIFPFSTTGGRPAVIEVVRDVSERSELERQIVRSTSLASLGEMAAGVAHEIRNPIGMIQSSAQLLERLVGLSERDRKLLGVIRDETARVNETISEFVGFASPPEPTRKVTPPGSLVERVQELLRHEAEHRKITLEASIAPDLPSILVDPELIYRALTNLVLNAIQVQADGGRVEIRATRSDGGIAIRVRDRGPGIPEEDLDQIFKPFFTRRAGGTGLGLSIVQRIVSANGGRIEVTSGSDGTEFVLRFAEVSE